MVTNELIKDIKFGSNITDGEEFKDILESIASIVCDSVVKTLGPYAATTIIDNGATTYSTKDGWSLVNTLRFGDAIENTLFKFIKDISFSLNSKVGDGTTTAIVAAKMFIDIFREWISEQRKNPNAPYHYVRQADILDKINEAGEEICRRLKSKKRLKTVKSPSDIYKIANISTNGNETISTMIKEIYEKTSNPNIHVSLNIGGPTYYDIQNGYKMDTTLLNPNCHINTGEDTCVFTKPVKVVAFNHNVTYAEHSAIINILINKYIDTQDTIVIMAPYFDDIIMSILTATLRQWANKGIRIAFVLVQVPTTTTIQKCFLNDFSVLCGMEIFDSSKVKMFNHLLSTEKNTEEEADKFDEFKHLAEVSNIKSTEDIINCVVGVANKLTIGKRFTLLEDFDKNTTVYKNMLKEIEDMYLAEKAKADSTKNYLTLDYSTIHMRYIKFSGCIGTIFVGGESELSCKCLKDAVDDAVLACRSAYENGFIRGMNIETISVIAEIITELNNAGKNDTLICECYKMIGRVFTGVTREVMYNKYRNEGFTEDLANMKWKYEFNCNNSKRNEKYNKLIQDSNAKKIYDISTTKDMISCIINTCVELGLEYNLVTEQFGPAGYSVVNSVSTDIEIIKATTNILSLLLSSNQLISLNKMCDRKIGKEQMLNDQKTKANYIAAGVIEALTDTRIDITGDEISISRE